MEAPRLIDYLNEHEPKGFTPKPCYIPESDTLVMFTDAAESYAKRVDELITMYLSLKTNEPVGFEIKGLRRHLAIANEINASGSCGQINYILKAIAVAGSARSPAEVRYFKKIGTTADESIGPEADELLVAAG